MSNSLKEIFKKYKLRIKKANTHPAKEIILFDFLRKVFGVGIEELALKTEIPLKSKVYGIKGRADLIHAGIVLEVKVNLKKRIRVS